MREPPDVEQQRIVSVLNERYHTTLAVADLALAVAHGFTSWDVLRLDADTGRRVTVLQWPDGAPSPADPEGNRH